LYFPGSSADVAGVVVAAGKPEYSRITGRTTVYVFKRSETSTTLDLDSPAHSYCPISHCRFSHIIDTLQFRVCHCSLCYSHLPGSYAFSLEPEFLESVCISECFVDGKEA
jgi:hypothetical protein